MSYTGVNLGLAASGTFSIAYGVSSNGSVVVGQADTSGVTRAAYWDNSNTIHLLPSLGSGSNPDDAAIGCSPDGTIIVGQSKDNSGLFHAVKWTGGPSWAVTDLGFLSGGNYSEAVGCSSDGSVIVGKSNNAPTGEFGVLLPTVWTNGTPAVLPLYSGDTKGACTSCSNDGTILFGSSGSNAHALKWTGGPSWGETLLPTSAGGTGGAALACSSNGGIAVGFTVDSSSQDHMAYWTGTTLTVVGGNNSSGNGCSAAGTTIAGISAGAAEVWLSGTPASLPAPSGISTALDALGISADASTIVGLGLTSLGNERAIKWSAVITSDIATVADLFFSPTSSFVDFTQVANRRKFIAVNGGAQNLNSDGSGPFAVSPPVFLSVQGADTPTDFAANQGRGGAFLQSGPAPTDGASDPPPVTVSTQSAASTTPFSAVLGDYLTGNIYAFSTTALSDNGQQRKWVRRWRALPGDTTSAVTFSYLALNMKSGIGVPPGTNPQLVLRWSDDGGKTWSGNRIIPVGVTGATTFTVKFNRLGSTQRFSGSTRIFELSSTDQFKVNIISAEVLVK